MSKRHRGIGSISRLASSLLSLALFTVVAACGEEAPVQDEAIRPVKTFEVGSTQAGLSREWPGRIEPTQNAEMSFNVGGDVVELPIEEGLEVTKGQLLAKLDAREYRARLDRERAQLRFDKTEFDRTSTLVASGAVARAELDRRTRSLAVSKAAVSEAKKALGDTKLTAPFSGTVAKKMVDNFQSVSAKQPVLVLQDATTLEVVTHVSQRDYAAAAPGLTIAERNEKSEGRIHVVLDTQPDLRIPARLKEMATVPDAITGTYEVTWSFEPPEGVNITPGMTAKVSLGVSGGAGGAEGAEGEGASPAVLIPIQAVVGSDDGSSHVWVIDRETMSVSEVGVELGDVSGDSIAITAGLSGGELLATTGVHAMREGLVVSRFEDLYGDVERAQ